MEDRPSRPRFRCSTFGLIGALVLMVPALASAQTGEVRGTVADSSGGTLPGVAITIRNEATGVERSVVTDDAGAFRVPALQPGPISSSRR